MEKKFARIALDELRQGRRGKHDELMRTILGELTSLPEGEALVIPLSDVKDVSVSELRAAIARATASRHLQVATSSDNANFYLWKRTKKTARYERNVNRVDSHLPNRRPSK